MELIYYVVPDGSCGPCTVGFFRQKIIIPESFTELENFSMVYQHEYTHLKNRDNLVKLLCLIVLWHPLDESGGISVAVPLPDHCRSCQ